MAIVIKDGLGELVDGVATDLASIGVTANVTIGWREPSKQANQGPGGANRVVFIPSDPNGAGGQIVGPKLPGPRPIIDPATPDKPVAYVRALRDWERTVVVSIWAVDTSAPNDERAQYEATVALFERVMQAVQRVTPVTVRWGRVDWVTPKERQFGRELRAALTFAYPLFDRPESVAYPENVSVTKDPPT